MNYKIKVLFIGDSSVGKSSILVRYTDNTFNSSIESTIGIDFRIKSIPYNDKKIRFQIWDTAGHEKYNSITNAYYSGSQVIIYVYDVSDRKSYDAIKSWLKRTSKYDMMKFLVANKIDRVAEVSDVEAIMFAEDNNMIFCKVSAKNNIGVSDMFETVCEKFMDSIEKKQDNFSQKDDANNDQILLLSQTNKSKSNCCF